MFMAITISNLSNKKAGKAFVYTDIHLDLQEKLISKNKQNNKIFSGNDILTDHDEQAIQNSVVNLLFQKRYLNPNINLQLRKYLGQPMNLGLQEVMGEDIAQILQFNEPRIKVENVIVGATPDNFSVNIAIIYTLVNFPNVIQTVTGIFDNNGVFTKINLNNA